ncbi:hypothetical protein WR25_09347 [Diploscapter pachys]|uniref:Uncharacterized protein n=1 Tax=Diploscapter pachys TaxID=2018661 RepID=A0A2A2L5J5_9BILA|nr:hypothetical protein WR25_09347 [Diploscapter pachys]
MSDDRNVFQKAADKTKEMASDAKEKITDTYHNMMGDNTTEDKAARQAKDTIDDVKDKAKEVHEKGQEKWEEFRDSADQQRQKCSDSMQNARDNMADKMHEGARKIEGH